LTDVVVDPPALTRRKMQRAVAVARGV